MINSSLVDSNMFLRSIFLSVDFFQNESSQLSKRYNIFKSKTKIYFQFFLDFEYDDNKILSYFDDFDKRIHCVCRMINTINMQNLSQENVSCLNTTLIVLMLANKRDQLPKYLKAIKIKSLENSANSILDPLNNFKDLLLFWQSHYLQKDKDCIGLEQV